MVGPPGFEPGTSCTPSKKRASIDSINLSCFQWLASNPDICFRSPQMALRPSSFTFFARSVCPGPRLNGVMQTGGRPAAFADCAGANGSDSHGFTGAGAGTLGSEKQ